MLIKIPALSFGGGVKKFATSQAGPLYCFPLPPLSLAVHLHILTARVGSTVCLDGQEQLKCFYFPLRFFLCLCFLCCPRIVPVALALRRQMDENVKPNCGQFSGAGEGGGNKQ